MEGQGEFPSNGAKNEEEKSQEIAPQKEVENTFAPFVILMGGPGTGKTKIGDIMQKGGDYVFHDIDRVRDEVVGPHNGVRKEDRIEKEEMKKSYEELFRRAKYDLMQGKKVVIAATMSGKISHENIMKIAEEAGMPYDAFVFTATREKLEENMEKRKKEGSDSNFTDVEDALGKALQVRESLGDSKLPVRTIDISDTKTVGEVFEKMKEKMKEKAEIYPSTPASTPTPAIAADA